MSNYEKDLKDSAKSYIKDLESYEIWAGDIGWQDWMLEYCKDESSFQDGGELTESDVKRIDDVLVGIWKEAMEEVEQ